MEYKSINKSYQPQMSVLINLLIELKYSKHAKQRGNIV